VAELNEKWQEEFNTLRRWRDELRVKLHLGKAEARERWEKLEKDWEHLEAKAKLLGEASKGDLAEVGQAARQLAKEIRKGYEHLKSLL